MRGKCETNILIHPLGISGYILFSRWDAKFEATLNNKPCVTQGDEGNVSLEWIDLN